MDLTGSLVTLRAHRVEDSESLEAIFADPEVTRWAGPKLVRPLRASEIQERADRRDPDRRSWTVEDREDGAVIGDAGLFKIDHLQRNCWFGITLGPPSRLGRGRGTEATVLATRHAFHWLGMEKVYLGVFEENPRAIAAYRKAGYEVEARLRRQVFLEGRLRDDLWMAVYRDHPLYAV
jgi:RimJ/RimL family protein N-acetyltransferase